MAWMFELQIWACCESYMAMDLVPGHWPGPVLGLGLAQALDPDPGPDLLPGPGPSSERGMVLAAYFSVGPSYWQ